MTVQFAPSSSLARRSAWLALASVLLQFLWRILPGGAGLAFLVAIVGGAGVPPLALVAVFVVAELASTSVSSWSSRTGS